jgi:predicted nucleic acid-binding protein
MKAVFDTSTLVAAILTGHPSYGACLPYLQQAQSGQIEGFIAAHTLAELYAVLTRMPQANISPSLAQQLIADNLQALETVPLVVDDYGAAIDLMVANNLPGGGIYDALIAQIAARMKAEILLTLNPRHFIRLGEFIAAKVQVPVIKGN